VGYSDIISMVVVTNYCQMKVIRVWKKAVIHDLKVLYDHMKGGTDEKDDKAQ